MVVIFCYIPITKSCPDCGAFLFLKMSTNNISSYYKKFEFAGTNAISNFNSGLRSQTMSSKISKITNNKPILFGGVILLVAIAFLLGRAVPGNDPRLTAPKALATQTLNKTYEFPLKDDSGNTVSHIAYTIQTANIQDSFIYQGKVAQAVKGRTFLIFNLKVDNPYTKTIQINARDYIRVRVNGTKEQLAPEIHNDPVEIDAKSTKYTRVGLPINDTDKDLEVLVGEITGTKKTLHLSLER